MLGLMYNRTKESKYKDEQPRVTRQGDAVLLRVPRANTSKFMNAPAYKGSTMWNQLPVEVRQVESRYALKIMHKRYLAGLPLNHGNSHTSNDIVNSSLIIED